MKKYFAMLAMVLAGLTFAKAEETTTVVEDDGISKKWEFKFDVGGMLTNTEDVSGVGYTRKGESLQYEVGVGYNFTKNFYAGLNTGYFQRFGFTVGLKEWKNNQIIPLMADFVYRWNLGQKWSVAAEGRGGYLFNLKKDTQTQTGVSYDPTGYTLLELMPGVYYRLKKNIDIRLSAGYAYAFENEDKKYDLTNNEKGFVCKLGMNFRGRCKDQVRTAVLAETVPPVVEEAAKPVEPEPTVKIVETTTEEQKQLGQREVVIYYLIRQHNILPEKDALLDELAEFTKTHKTTKVIVKSYADKGTGNYKLNQMYSRNRMNEVRKHLIEKYGIPADRIESSYYGDTVQPFEENDQNRCSIVVVKEVE